MPFAVYLDENDETYVEPDIAVVCDKNKMNDKGCFSALDLIIEVISPSSKSILVYLLEQNEAPVIYRFTDIIKVNIFDDLNIILENLLAE